MVGRDRLLPFRSNQQPGNLQYQRVLSMKPRWDIIRVRGFEFANQFFRPGSVSVVPSIGSFGKIFLEGNAISKTLFII